MKSILSLSIVLSLSAITQAQGVLSFVTLLPEYKNDVVMPKVIPLAKENLTPANFFALTSIVQEQKDFNAIEKVYNKPVKDQTVYYTSRPLRGRWASRGDCSSSATYNSYSTSTGNGGGYGVFGLRDRPIRFRNALPRNWRVNQ